jgi:hypothetical protein
MPGVRLIAFPGSNALAARETVAIQAEAREPDLAIIHRCLTSLQNELRAANVDDCEQELVDKALKEIKSCTSTFGRPTADRLYSNAASLARPMKALVQMAIGIWVVVILLWLLYNNRTSGCLVTRGDACVLSPPHWMPVFSAREVTLSLIADALAAAALVELAYTLFTDGPDEAIDPLMLGLSSFLILELGKASLRWQDGLGIVLGVVSLGILFAVRREFVMEAENSLRHSWWHWFKKFRFGHARQPD